MWVKRVTVAFFLAHSGYCTQFDPHPFTHIYWNGFLPFPLTSEAPARQIESAAGGSCCSDWNLWRMGSFGRLDLRQFSWDFLGPNLSIWNGHISQNPFSIGYRPFPLTIRNQRRSVVHALPGCPSCQRRARVLGASFLGGTRVRPPMSSYDHHFQPESRFGTCFCSVWQLTSGR